MKHLRIVVDGLSLFKEQVDIMNQDSCIMIMLFLTTSPLRLWLVALAPFPLNFESCTEKILSQ